MDEKNTETTGMTKKLAFLGGAALTTGLFVLREFDPALLPTRRERELVRRELEGLAKRAR